MDKYQKAIAHKSLSLPLCFPTATFSKKSGADSGLFQSLPRLFTLEQSVVFKPFSAIAGQATSAGIVFCELVGPEAADCNRRAMADEHQKLVGATTVGQDGLSQNGYGDI